MGDFITRLTDPVLFATGDKTPASGVSLRPEWTFKNVIRATEANGLRDALLDARTALRGPILNANHFGVTGDGATDDGPYLQALINQVASAETAWSSPARSAGITRIILPRATSAYRIATQVLVPGDKAIRIEAEGPCGARLVWAGDPTEYMIRIVATNSWAASNAYNTLGERAVRNSNVYRVITTGTSAASGGPSGTTADITDGTVHWAYVGPSSAASATTTARASSLAGLVFDGGGLLYNGNNRLSHTVEHCIFKGTAVPAIAAGGQSIVGVRLHRNFFSGCAGSLSVPYPNCDLWVLDQCTHVRGSATDVDIQSGDFTVYGNDFETRKSANSDQPFIRCGSDVKILFNRFGDENEVATSVHAPEVAIVIGDVVAGTDDTAAERVKIVGNNFYGTNSVGGPTVTDARTAIALTGPVRDCVIAENTFADAYLESIVEERYIASGTNGSRDHGGNVWTGNTVARSHVAPIFSEGGAGWIVSGGSAVATRVGCPGRRLQNLLGRSDDLTAASWTLSGGSIAKDAVGPDGVAASACTLTKTTANASASVHRAAVAASVGGEGYTFSCWLKAGTLDRARLAIYANGFLTPTVTILRLDSEWRRYSVHVPLMGATLTPSCYIYAGNDLDTAAAGATGTVLVFGPQLHAGIEEAPYLPNLNATAHAATPFQALLLGGNVVGYGTAMPSTGRYEVGDTWLNTAPDVGQPTGWRCIAAGSPGTWAPLPGQAAARADSVAAASVAALETIVNDLLAKLRASGALAT